MGLFCRFQLKLQQFCVKPFVGHANLIRCRYWRLEERRDGAVSRVVSVFFCAVYIVLLGQCYVAMPSGYKLVITRALGLHGILLHSALGAGALVLQCNIIIPYIPRARVITITYYIQIASIPGRSQLRKTAWYTLSAHASVAGA